MRARRSPSAFTLSLLVVASCTQGDGDGLDDLAFMAAYPSLLLDRLDCVPRDE